MTHQARENPSGWQNGERESALRWMQRLLARLNGKPDHADDCLWLIRLHDLISREASALPQPATTVGGARSPEMELIEHWRIVAEQWLDAAKHQQSPANREDALAEAEWAKLTADALEAATVAAQPVDAGKAIGASIDADLHSAIEAAVYRAGVGGTERPELIEEIEAIIKTAITDLPGKAIGVPVAFRFKADDPNYDDAFVYCATEEMAVLRAKGKPVEPLYTTPPNAGESASFADKLASDSPDAIMEVVGEGQEFAAYNKGKSAMRDWFLKRVAKPQTNAGESDNAVINRLIAEAERRWGGTRGLNLTPAEIIRNVATVAEEATPNRNAGESERVQALEEVEALVRKIGAGWKEEASSPTLKPGGPGQGHMASSYTAALIIADEIAALAKAQP